MSDEILAKVQAISETLVWKTEIELLEAENRRLRGSLEHIARLPEEHKGDSVEAVFSRAIQIASKALQPKREAL